MAFLRARTIQTLKNLNRSQELGRVRALGGRALACRYFAGAVGLVLGAGEGDAAGAGGALPAVAGAAGVAAAAACGWAPGLIQQAWIRLDRVSATLGSIWPPKR